MKHRIDNEETLVAVIPDIKTKEFNYMWIKQGISLFLSGVQDRYTKTESDTHEGAMYDLWVKK